MPYKKRSKPKSRRPKNRQHKKLTYSEKEHVIALRIAGNTIKDVANKTNLGYSTVEHVLKHQDEDPELLQRARAEGARMMAMAVAEKADLALAAVTPESLQHDRVEVRDKEGKLVAVNHSGPNGAQIATAFGILRDKVDKLFDEADKLEAGTDNNQLAPGQMGDMLASLAERIERIGSVSADIDLEKMRARVEVLAEEYAEDTPEQLDADYEILDDDVDEIPDDA